MKAEIINSKREAHKQELREQLLEQGFLLFSEKGLEQTTVADIVEKCHIARGTFYNYFSDINALFDALINELNTRIGEEVKKTRKETHTVYDYLYGTFKSYYNIIGTPEMIQFHIINQAHIRQSTYQSDMIKTIVKNLIRDLKSSKKFPPILLII